MDAHYPIVQDKTVNSQYLMSICNQFGWEYLRPYRNGGVGKNWDWIVKELNLGENDILAGIDPDGNPLDEKYLDAAMRVFNNDASCVTVQLNDVGVYKMAHIPRDEFLIDGTCVVHYKQVTAWPLGSFSVSWLKRIGGFLQLHPLYGHCERAMYDKFNPLGGRVLMLRDYRDEHLKATDAKYTEWKAACANHQTQLPLDQWLRFYGN